MNNLMVHQNVKEKAYLRREERRQKIKEQPRSMPLVMVVENHEDTRSLLKFLLEAHGYQVIEAADSEQALQFAENCKPDLVLMEIMLPAVDGLLLMSQLRNFESLANVPIVFLSSRAEPAIKSEALSLGGNDFLVKPVDLDCLEEIFAKYLKRGITTALQIKKSKQFSQNG